MTFLSLHNEPEPRPSRKGWSGFGCCVAIFLLPNSAPYLENRIIVCMGYPAMTLRRRAGKRRRKGAGKPCRENGAPNINWSKWPVDVVNDTKRHSPETSSTLQLVQCVQIEHIDSIHVTLNLDLTFCQATVKSGKCCFSVLTKLP